MTEKKISRRDLLKKSALAAAGFTIVPRYVLGGPGYTPPSEELTKAVIGTGGMGKGHLRYPGRLLAVCDVDANHLKEALEIANNELKFQAKGYRDFREVLARKDIDIVHIPTPPHWHAAITIAAAEAGKDIWCEKPMARTIGESKRMMEAVQKHGRMFRLNTWFRFEDEWHGCGTTAKPLKQIVESGELGWPIKMVIGDGQGFNWKLEMWSGKVDLKPEDPPKELDYEMWLGPAPYKPYHPHRVHQSFRGYWDYDGGGLGDMGQHYLDPVQYLMGKDDTSPVFIEAEGPQQHPDAVGLWRRVYIRYADGCEIILDGSNEMLDAPMIEGPKGKLWKNLKSTIPDLEKKLKQMPDPEPMVTDFHKAVRTRQKFALNEANGHRSCTLVNMAKIAVRLMRPLRYDPVKQEFINDEEANRLINEPMRAPWYV